MKQVSEDTRGVEGRRPSPENEEDQRQKSPHVSEIKCRVQNWDLKMGFENPIYKYTRRVELPPGSLSCVGTMSVAAFNQNAAAAVRDYQVNPRLGTIHVNLSSSLPRRPLARPLLRSCCASLSRTPLVTHPTRANPTTPPRTHTLAPQITARLRV